jgi:cephalosporin hydroxylase
MENSYKDLSMKHQFITDKLSWQGDYNVNAHTYSVIYDRLFAPFKHKPINFLEIGVYLGGNIAICSEYFENINHYGIDIVDNLKIDKNLFSFYFGSFDDPNIISQVSERKYDIILEDASHILEHQMEAIKIYLPLLNEGGIMIIEDIQDPSFIGSIYSVIDMQKYFVYTIDLRVNKNRWDDLIVVIEHRSEKYR